MKFENSYDYMMHRNIVTSNMNAYFRAYKSIVNLVVIGTTLFYYSTVRDTQKLLCQTTVVCSATFYTPRIHAHLN